jgi:hypothetical protein
MLQPYYTQSSVVLYLGFKIMPLLSLDWIGMEDGAMQ